jgi:hypothetical protein
MLHRHPFRQFQYEAACVQTGFQQRLANFFLGMAVVCA